MTPQKPFSHGWINTCTKAKPPAATSSLWPSRVEPSSPESNCTSSQYNDIGQAISCAAANGSCFCACFSLPNCYRYVWLCRRRAVLSGRTKNWRRCENRMDNMRAGIGLTLVAVVLRLSARAVRQGSASRTTAELKSGGNSNRPM